MRQEIKLSVRDDEEFNELLSKYSSEHQSSIFENAMVLANSAEINFNMNGIEKDNSINELCERFYSTENMMRVLNERLLGSSTKGQVGEIGLNEVLSTFLRGYSVTNTDKIAHSGDFIIECNKIKIMLDSKLYKKTVSKVEIDKLIRDMEENEIKYGILISATASIAGKAPPIDYEKREDGKYIVYVSKCSVDHVVGAVKLCELYDGIEKTPDLWNPEISFSRIEKSIEKLKKTYTALSEVSNNLGRISIEINLIKEKCDNALKEFLTDMTEMTTSLREEFSHISEDIRFFTPDELEKYIIENTSKNTISEVKNAVTLLGKKDVEFLTSNKCIELYKNNTRIGKIKLGSKDSELDFGDLKMKLSGQGGHKKGVETIIDIYVPSRNT